MEQDFTEAVVEGFVEPAGAAQGDGKRPVDDGVALIVFPRQTREEEAPIDALAVEWIRTLGVFLRLHERSDPTHVGCYE